MSRISVMKLGGSVLGALWAATLDAVTVTARSGWRVVAVVSALPGETDRLAGLAGAIGDPVAQPHLYAEALATGEEAAVALVALGLAARGVTVAAATNRELTMRTTGRPLDSDPVDADTAWLVPALRRHQVVVVPGFIGRGRNGRTTLLGRGGTDLSALFLAWLLSARCTLVKDVDGLFAWDPNDNSRQAPLRFSRAHWNDVARHGDSLVQPKAVDFARARGLPFLVAAPGGRGTEVGDHHAEYASEEILTADGSHG